VCVCVFVFVCVCVCVCVWQISVTTMGLHGIVTHINKVCVYKIKRRNDYKNTKKIQKYDRQKEPRATRYINNTYSAWYDYLLNWCFFRFMGTNLICHTLKSWVFTIWVEMVWLARQGVWTAEAGFTTSFGSLEQLDVDVNQLEKSPPPVE
jgi:hypothetical protein